MEFSIPADAAVVWGHPGCGLCRRGLSLCGGGGYALSRITAQRLAADGPDIFKAEFLQYARGMARNWSDVAFGCVAQKQGIELKFLPGIHSTVIPG